MRLHLVLFNGRLVAALCVADQVVGFVRVKGDDPEQSVVLVDSPHDATVFLSEIDAYLAAYRMPPTEVSRNIGLMVDRLAAELNCQKADVALLTSAMSRFGQDEFSIGLVAMLRMLLPYRQKWSLIQQTSGVSVVKAFATLTTEALSNYGARPTVALLDPLLKGFAESVDALEYFVRLPFESQVIMIVRSIPNLDYWMAEIVAQSLVNTCTPEESGMLSEGIQLLLGGHLNKATASLIESGRKLFPESDFFNAA
jgi:hypothetical protein